MNISKSFFVVLLTLFQYFLLAQTTDSIKDVFGEKEEKLYNFTGHIYYLPDSTLKLPDFSKLKSRGKIFTNSLNIKDQAFNKGFPGISNRFENFAIDYTGQFYVNEKHKYCFMLGSDDGSKLFIDDKLIINNDHVHPIKYKSNCLSLNKGTHSIEVQYFQGPRYQVALMLQYKKEGDSVFQTFNISKFYPITVTEKESTIDVSIGNEILFAHASYNLGVDAKLALKEVKRLIIDNIKLDGIIIEGHTDDTGSDSYNQKLSEQRAEAVKLYLVSIGIGVELIKTLGYGESKPKIPNVDSYTRKQNRRIELIFNKQ